MAGVHIVVDNGAALPPGAAQDYSLSIVTYNVGLGEDLFHGGTDEPDLGFVEMLRDTQAAPTITAPPVEDYRNAFKEILGWGVDVLSLHPPASVLDSAAVARQAASELAEGSERVRIVETICLGPALGLLAIRAAQAGIDEHPLDAIADMVKAIQHRIRMVAVATDAAFAGGLGGLELGEADPEDSPALLELREGRLQLLSRPPDLGQALRALVAAIEGDSAPAQGETKEDSSEGEWHLAAFSAAADAEAAAIATFLETRHAMSEAWIAPCDPLLVAMLGAGAFGVACYGE
jgi:fatty acid-binding protein DegV